MATWVEDNSSRSATFYRLGRRATSTYTKSYKVFGYTSDVDLQADADQRIRTTLLGFRYPGTNVELMVESYSISYLGDDVWQVTINYEKEGADDESQTEPLKRARSFDTAGGTQHITQAINETAYGPGEGGSGAPTFNKAIGVDGDSVAGVDIVVPQLTWSEQYDVPSTYVTDAYIKGLATVTGSVNDATFRTFAAGEVLFLGASGSQEWDDTRGDGPWSLSYKFAASPNAGSGKTIPAITIGSISGIQKKGHEYLWVRYEPGVESDTLIKVPRGVYVNEVYRSASFSALGIGS